VGRKRTGTVEWHDDHWDARARLSDGKYGPRQCLPSKWSEAKSREKAAQMTEVAAKIGAVSQPKPKREPKVEVKGTTVTEWFGAWLDDRERRGLTSVSDDRGRWSKWIQPELGDLDMATVPPDELESFVEKIDKRVLAGDLSWKTAKNIWGLVTKAFDDAARSKTRALRVRKDNPAKDVRGPDQGTKKSKQYLYPSEFLALVNNESVSLRWRRLVALHIYSYARAGEVEALHVDDVDLEHGTFHVHRAIDRDKGTEKETKTNNPRRVPIEPNLMPLVKRLVAEAREQGRTHLVTMPEVHSLAPRLREYLKLSGVGRAELYADSATCKRMTWHDLRATGATWMAIRGDEPQRIMARCGHENMATTMGYVREAESLNVPRDAVFPVLPPSLIAPDHTPEGPSTWGRLGGKSLKRLKSFSRPQRDSNPAVAHTYAQNAHGNVQVADVDTCGTRTDKYAESRPMGPTGLNGAGEHPNPLGSLHCPTDPPPRVPDPHEPVRLNLERAVRLAVTEQPDAATEATVADLLEDAADRLSLSDPTSATGGAS
jgi:integrase